MPEPRFRAKRERRQLVRFSLLCLLFGALTLVMVGPIIHPSRLWDSLPFGDARLNFWALTWESNALRHNPWDLLNGNAFYPASRSITLSEHLLGLLLCFLPLHWITGNSVLAYNLTLLLSYPLTGVCFYKLLRELKLSLYASVTSALYFTFCFYRTVHVYSRIQLLHQEWLFASLVFLYRYRERQLVRYLIGFSGFFLLNILTSWYNGFLGAVAIGVITLVWVIQKQLPWSRVWGLSGCGLLLLVVISPLLLLYNREEQAVDLKTLTWFSCAAADYLRPPYGTLWNRLGGSEDRPWNEWTLFIGYLPVVLSCLGSGMLVKKLDASRWTALVQGLTLLSIGWIGSLGPHWNRSLEGVRLPYYLLVKAVPALAAIRAPARYGVLVYLGLAVILGRSLDNLYRHVGPRLKLFMAVIPLLLLAEQYPGLRFPQAQLASWPETDWIKGLPAEASLAYYPDFFSETDDFWWLNADYMVQAAIHGRPIANGYSRYFPERYPEVVKAINEFPTAVSLETLTQFGIDYLIVHFERVFQSELIDFFRNQSAGFHSEAAMIRGFQFQQAFLSPARVPGKQGLAVKARFAESGLPVAYRAGEVWVYDLKKCLAVLRMSE